MSLFKLDTDIVSDGAGAIKSFSSQLEDLADTVGGYDAKCDNGFDFAGARSAIAKNIDAFATKFSNVYLYSEAVVSSHSQLQKNEFIDPEEQERLRLEAEQKKKSSGGGGGNSGSGGGHRFGGSSGSGGSSGMISSTAKEVASLLASPVLHAVKKGIIDKKLKNVDYVYLDSKSLPADTINFLNSEGYDYLDVGYAVSGSRYMISCDASIGNVGDVISFTKKDGTVIECVVAVTTTSEKNKDTINFILDPNKEEVYELKDSRLLLSDLTKVENLGNVSGVPKHQFNKDENGNVIVEKTSESTSTNSTSSDKIDTTATDNNTGTNNSNNTTNNSNNNTTNNNGNGEQLVNVEAPEGENPGTTSSTVGEDPNEVVIPDVG